MKLINKLSVKHPMQKCIIVAKMYIGGRKLKTLLWKDILQLKSRVACVSYSMRIHLYISGKINVRWKRLIDTLAMMPFSLQAM